MVRGARIILGCCGVVWLLLAGLSACDSRGFNLLSVSSTASPRPSQSATPSVTPTATSGSSVTATPTPGSTGAANCDANAVLVLRNAAAPRLVMDPADNNRLALAANDSKGEIILAQSTNGGASWSTHNVTNGSHQGVAPDLAQLSTGGQAAVWADNANNVLLATIDPNGQTSGPSQIAVGSNFDFPSVSGDPASANLYVAFNDGTDGISISKAAAGGSFGTPKQVADAGSFPTIAARDGMVLVSWRDSNFDVVGRTSTDGATTFGPELKLFQNSNSSNNVTHVEFGSLLFSANHISQIGSNDGAGGNFAFISVGDPSGEKFSARSFAGTNVVRANGYVVGGDTVAVASLGGDGSITLFKFDLNSGLAGSALTISNQKAVEFSITGNAADAFVALTKSQSPGDIVVGSCQRP